MSTVIDEQARVDGPSGGPEVYRFEVWLRGDEPDSHARAVVGKVESGSRVEMAQAARVFLIQGLQSAEQAEQIGRELLADPVSDELVMGSRRAGEGRQVLEIHFQPGVMDPVAQSTLEAIVDLLPDLSNAGLEVRTALRVDLLFDRPVNQKGLTHLATRYFANPVIQDIHFEPWQPERFPVPPQHAFTLTRVPLLGLDDAGLMKLSREGHLFLSLEEMQAVQAWFAKRATTRPAPGSTPGQRPCEALAKQGSTPGNVPSGDATAESAEKTVAYGDLDEPTDIELETIAQTWSEHCVHKTLKSGVRYRSSGEEALLSRWAARSGHRLEDDGSLIIDNLLKHTIAQATHDLCQDAELNNWCISVFKDNAGIVRFDDAHGVCIKVETHNHPSAIEPYGGAATGIGGCIRDIMGTGLFAWPIANTNVFCVADPEMEEAEVPKGVIHPRRVLEQVVAGVRDYGNRKGIPTVNGAVYFHDAYLGNPLVFAGSVGLIGADRCFGEARPGDLIVALGGRTGRDGIHGATFSSAELTDQHADEFGHAVQIGNAITQKRVMDVLKQAGCWREPGSDGPGRCLYHAITDCGAGGFSSAIGEMGEKIGAWVNLEAAPLKYQGLTYREIWISEAQERMVVAVGKADLEILRSLCLAENVELCVMGRFGCLDGEGEPELVLNFEGHEVGRLSMAFLHEGIPMPQREAVWTEPARLRSGGAVSAFGPGVSGKGPAELLTELLAHPNIASKHWVIRQYDHEVQGGSVIKPLMGPAQDAPQNGAVLRPRLDSRRGIALGCGLQTGIGDPERGGDAYLMALAAVDEAVRNVVSVGGNPERIAILDNFCWPRCDDPEVMGWLVRACEGCYDAAMAYRTPFVSGKDSLNNQFTADNGRVIRIPPTLLITAMGMVDDVRRSVSSDAKRAGRLLLLIGITTEALGGSHLALIDPATNNGSLPVTDLAAGPANARAVSALIAEGLAASVHDVSDGGLLVAAAEMSFGGGLGVELDLGVVPTGDSKVSMLARAFAETPSRYLVEVEPDDLGRVEQLLGERGVAFGVIGSLSEEPRFCVQPGDGGATIEVAAGRLRAAWLGRLDWS